MLKYFLISASIFVSCREDFKDSSKINVIGGQDAGKNLSLAGLTKSISTNPSVFCGATFIRHDVLVTAAHCVDDLSNAIHALIGADKLADVKKEQFVKVQEIRIHPNWRKHNVSAGFDIAILFLEKSSVEKLKVQIKPVAFNEKISTDSKVGEVFGWGYRSSFGFLRAESRLQKAEIPLNELKECKNLKGPSYEQDRYRDLSDALLCAGDIVKGGKDTCEGDSGGPLFVKNGEKIIFAGVASFGGSCGQPKSAGLYTKVFAYSKWISENLELFKPEFGVESLRNSFRHRCFLDVESSPQGIEGLKINASPNEVGIFKKENPDFERIIISKIHCNTTSEQYADGKEYPIKSTLEVVRLKSGEVNAFYKIETLGHTFYAKADYYADLYVSCERKDRSQHSYASLSLVGEKISGNVKSNSKGYYIKDVVPIDVKDWAIEEECAEHVFGGTHQNPIFFI